MALALAALASAGLFNAAHATFPGENGVIVFDSVNSDGTQVIKKVSPNNTAVTELTTGHSPSVSPNGKKIVFVRGSNVYVMNIDGSNVVQLTYLSDSSFPAWLPDGSKVTFVYYGSYPQAALFTVNPDGTGATWRRDLTNGGVGYAKNFSYSPRGGAFTYDTARGLALATDSSFDYRVLSSTGNSASWAPDGASILHRDSRSSDLYEINPEGTNDRKLLGDNAGNSVSSISPDGAFIAGAVLLPGGDTKLTTRARAGTPSTFSWPSNAGKTDWSRVPKNCYTSTPQGGGGVLAGDVDAYLAQCAIAVMPNPFGSQGAIQQQAIAVGPDQRLYHRTLQAGPPGGAPIWTPFSLVPGVGGNPNGINAKKIAIAASNDGSAQVVIINADDNLVYHAMRSANGTWSGFLLLDGVGPARDVAIAIGSSTPTSPGTAQVITNSLTFNGVYHRVRSPAGSWTPFRLIPDSNFTQHPELAIAVGEDGVANILTTIVEVDGVAVRLMHALRYADGNWSRWVMLGVSGGTTTLSTSSDVAVTRTPNGTAQLLYTDAAGNVLYQERPTPSDAFSWGTVRPAVPIANTVGRAVSISAAPKANLSSQILLTQTSPQ